MWPPVNIVTPTGVKVMVGCRSLGGIRHAGRGKGHRLRAAMVDGAV